MPLFDDIEHYGRAVAAGDITCDAAVQALMEISSGGLTAVGAGTAIDAWLPELDGTSRLGRDSVPRLTTTPQADPLQPEGLAPWNAPPRGSRLSS
ncbi:hypothetical protein ACF07Y_46315 [Streptomyces sp. NPDC016566]|uniref:hypothetical protein n=1 Tax=Streptomyces sp. NPDC016566 TaxID=3364967 RepID=UPI0036FFF30C